MKITQVSVSERFRPKTAPYGEQCCICNAYEKSMQNMVEVTHEWVHGETDPDPGQRFWCTQYFHKKCVKLMQMISEQLSEKDEAHSMAVYRVPKITKVRNRG